MNRKFMKYSHNFGRHLGRNVVAALVVAAGLVGMRIAEAQAAPKAQVAPKVVGKLLQVGGTRFVVKGAAAYILPFYTSADGSKEFAQDYTYQRMFAAKDAVFAQMKSIGINSVRLPVASSTYGGADPYNLGGKAGYLDKLAAIVASANSQGLYVLIGWWEPLGYAPALSMMSDVHAKLGNNPMVMYEPFNEPNGISWDQWRQPMRDTIRHWRQDIGYTGVLFIDTINWSWWFSPSEAQGLMNYDAGLTGRGPNLMFANHRYANQNTNFLVADKAAWESEVGQYVGSYPIIGTEYGFYNFQGPPQLQWNQEFFSYLADTKVPQGFNGAWLFVWRWVDSNSMTDNDMFTLWPNGTTARDYFYNRLAAPPPAPTAPTKSSR